jgi:hypothetical protein
VWGNLSLLFNSLHLWYKWIQGCKLLLTVTPPKNIWLPLRKILYLPGLLLVSNLTHPLCGEKANSQQGYLSEFLGQEVRASVCLRQGDKPWLSPLSSGHSRVWLHVMDKSSFRREEVKLPPWENWFFPMGNGWHHPEDSLHHSRYVLEKHLLFPLNSNVSSSLEGEMTPPQAGNSLGNQDTNGSIQVPAWSRPWSWRLWLATWCSRRRKGESGSSHPSLATFYVMWLWSHTAFKWCHCSEPRFVAINTWQ